MQFYNSVYIFINPSEFIKFKAFLKLQMVNLIKIIFVQ